MKQGFLLVMALLSVIGAAAQGVKFGPRYMREQSALKMAQWKKQQTVGADMGAQTRAAILDEYTEVVDNYGEDVRYRYVYAYDANFMRSSETIYKTVKTDGVWGEETLYDVGSYTYEYDSQGRVKVKSVTYGQEYGDFESYRIMVDYGTAGLTTYTKYEFDTYESVYSEIEAWSYRADGSMASHTVYEFSGDNPDVWEYDAQGNVTRYNGYSFSGTQNEGTIVINETDNVRYEHFSYDSKSGKLLEYWGTNGYNDDVKYTFEYDAFGRISSIKEYNLGDDEEVTVEEGTIIETRATLSSNWLLTYEENYTYFNDEVYGITNPWKVTFGMDGPLTQITWTEYESGSSYGEDINGDGVIDDNDRRSYGTETTYFQRDANGVLTVIRYSNSETESGTEYNITVNANGEIVSMKDEYEITWTENGVTCRDYSLEETTYTWENGKIVKEVTKSEWSWWSPDGDYSGNSTSETSYAYTDNSVTKTDESGNVTEIMQDGTKYMVRKWSGDEFDWESDDYIVRDIQTEDVSFIRPNIKKAMDGFSADVPIVLSRAGRVVCAAYESMSSGYEFFYSEMDESYHYRTVKDEEDEYSSKDDLMGIYYSISHDGANTVCSNIEGLPVYVLQGNRLLKEYEYYDLVSSIGPAEPEAGAETRAIVIPAGQAYDEISYIYNDAGQLVGKSLVSVDSEGTHTEEVTVEYKYNAAGIVSVEASARPGVQLSGRTLGLTDGTSFSVFTLAGSCLAESVQTHTFTSAGIYVIQAGGLSIKVAVR